MTYEGERRVEDHGNNEWRVTDHCNGGWMNAVQLPNLLFKDALEFFTILRCSVKLLCSGLIIRYFYFDSLHILRNYFFCSSSDQKE